MAQKLETGFNAPQFELPDQEGKLHKLSDYKGKKVVLYFYPKDDTPGCTMEANGMKMNFDKFRNAGMEVIGVSADSVESHKRFSQKFDLPFTLLSDENHKTIEQYGAWQNKTLLQKIIPGVKRTTYIIDEKGTIIKIYERVKPAEHAEEILRDLKAY